ncbi:UV-damage endonuclease, partial [Ascosphaera acerosa]
KYGIRFLRLSSEMFPFASHEEYGYRLAPFASEVLAEAGLVAARYGHRLTTHPGQFTQLGSPREIVATNAVRDLEYHNEMLSLLRLPAQQDRDAVIIIHMGGVFGNKEETLERFRKNYALLSDAIKARVVLENDDVGWTVHDLLPVCEELNIPLVLDYHHHNINFDPAQLREGTLDIMQLYGRIRATWARKGITPKMHYSEPCPPAITPRQRRKHSPRVQMLPPCDPTMDLMIEAKDKEQAVFDLMRTYKLPGFEKINDIIPHQRQDENKPLPKRRSKKAIEEAELNPVPVVPDEEVGMGGPDNRVHWPPGMEIWLKPPKRVVGPKKTPTKRKAAVKVEVEEEESTVVEGDVAATPAKKTKTCKRKAKPAKAEPESESDEDSDEDAAPATPSKRATPRRKAAAKRKKVVDEPDSLTDEPTTPPSLSEDDYVPQKKKRGRKAKQAKQEPD